MRMAERVDATAVLVDGLIEIDVVHPDVVDREPNRSLVPQHPPHVKFPRPLRVAERVERLANDVPDRARARGTAPRDVGEYRAAVVLHDVDLAAMRPSA